MIILFWLSFFLVFYTYVGYPLILFAVSSFARKKVHKRAAEPKVSIILSAFNEEKWIEKKLLNLLELDYPEEKLEILVGSDGALDKTDEIISKFKSPRVRFFRFVRNLGKPQVLQSLVEEAHGSILVFTDARQEFDREAVRALVANFEDRSVGCVSGELYFKPNGHTKAASIGKGMDIYWKYEKFLRKKESEIGSMLGATGAIYAIRKRLFPHLPVDILVDDMYVPLSIIGKGHRAIFESAAKAYDHPSEHGKQEFKRKVRTLAGNYQILAKLPALLNPFKSPIAWQLFSHKLLRLAAPFFLLGILLANAFLISNLFYLILFVTQIVFYGLALSGKKGIGYIPYTFCLLNYSAVMGLVRYLKKDHHVTWEKAYV
ncbi:MAG: glycosyltransferase family 2 protein [Candidatus Omnitrophica bacterium]|nr:glycosyltransferase family 2 protein [Candidatus Omnitrophota bacterium]